jgi:SAM-dependent methyltransferase
LPLVAWRAPPHKPRVTPPSPTAPPDLFDRRRRALVRDRAARAGPELFLHERAFAECLDRLADVKRRFTNALLIGVPHPAWVDRLAAFGITVEALDPGALFAAAARATHAEEDRHAFGGARFDLVVAVGTLDTVNRLGPALQAIRHALRPDGAFIGALAGGDSLPALRSAMLAADRATGPAAARTHPRIEPSALAGLLGAAGFVMPVVDVDRIALRYASLAALVRDLRAMGASNQLAERAPPRGRHWARLAAAAFAAQSVDGRTEERVDLLHFIAWAPPSAE